MHTPQFGLLWEAVCEEDLQGLQRGHGIAKVMSGPVPLILGFLQGCSCILPLLHLQALTAPHHMRTFRPAPLCSSGMGMRNCPQALLQ